MDLSTGEGADVRLCALRKIHLPNFSDCFPIYHELLLTWTVHCHSFKRNVTAYGIRDAFVFVR